MSDQFLAGATGSPQDGPIGPIGEGGTPDPASALDVGRAGGGHLSGATPPPAPTGEAGASQSQSERQAKENMEQRLNLQAKEYEKREARMQAGHEQRRALDALESSIEAVRGETIGDFKLRESFRNLERRVLSEWGKEVLNEQPKEGQTERSKVSLAWVKDKILGLHKARTDEIKAAGNDGDPLSVGNMVLSGTGERPDQRFMLSRLLNGLRDQLSGKDGKKLEKVEDLTGSVEAEAIQKLMARPQYNEMLAKMPEARDPKALRFPIPLHSIEDEAMGMAGPMQRQRLAQTYGTDGGNTAEPDYRGELLVPYFRPLSNLEFLGAMMATISNNVTLPTLADSIVAEWESGENDPANEDALVVNTVTTSPKRAAATDSISWQLLVAADRDFGIMPRVLQEILRAMMQIKEQAAYVGTGAAGQPMGAWNYSGVLAGSLTAGTPTYKEVLDIPNQVATQDIPLDMGGWVTTWALKNLFQSTLNFTNSVSSVPLFRTTTEPGNPGMQRTPSGRGVLADFPLAATSQMPTKATSASNLAGGTLHTILFGIWSYLSVFDYSTAFLTVDDLSLANRAQTRVTINGFCDVINRLPKGWVRLAYAAA